MPIDTPHPSYDRACDAWKLVRDTAYGGGRRVKAEGPRYLPAVSGMTPLEYDAYVMRANFFNVTKRTLAAFSGFVFVNNPEVEVTASPSPNIEALISDATMAGNTFYDYQKSTVRETLSLGRPGTLVEWASPALENRPFLIHYDSEDILNWRYAQVGGRRKLTLLVLREKTTVDGEDPYQPDMVTRYRVLRLVNNGVEIVLYEATESGDFAVVNQAVPMRRTTPLTTIPFIFHNVTGDEAEPENIPLDDLAQLNVSHYHNSADVEQGRHVCGLPTLILTGFPLQGEYILGATRALVSEEANADGKFLQIDANSLSALTGAMDQKERQMAALGARMLERQGGEASPEAFQTVQIRQSGEVSALTDIAIACSETLSRVLRLCVWWDDVSVAEPDDLEEEVWVELNTDFTTAPLEPSMLTALTQAYQSGAISYEEYFVRLQKGGVISSEKKIDDEIEAIKNSPINLPAAGAKAPPGQEPPKPKPGEEPPPGE